MDRGASLRLSFDLCEDALTKAQSAAESSVSLLQVGIYDADGHKEWEKSYEGAFSVPKTVSGLREGRKTIVALANKSITMPDILEDFFSIPTSLSDNRRNSFVMVGSAGAIADVQPSEVTVHLERIAAKISFRNAILLNWTSSPPADFAIEAVYVANAGVESTLAADGGADPALNPRASLEQTADEVLRDLTVSELVSWKGSGDVFNKGVDFYVYPNSTSTRTTLVIRTRFDGHTSYYPLVIDRPIERNTQYRCGSITITTDGMPSPADEFSSIRINYKYESSDWSEQSIGDAISF